MKLGKPKTMNYSNRNNQLIKNKIIKNTCDNSEYSNKKEININVQKK